MSPFTSQPPRRGATCSPSASARPRHARRDAMPARSIPAGAARQDDRIREHQALLLVTQRVRAPLHRRGDRAGPAGARTVGGPALARHRSAGDRVEMRIHHRIHEPRRLSGALGVGTHGPQLLRRIRLLGNHEQPGPAQRASERGPARVDGDRDRQRERTDHGQQPPDVRGRQPVHGDAPAEPSSVCEPMAAGGLAPRRLGVLSRRALPVHARHSSARPARTGCGTACARAPGPRTRISSISTLSATPAAPPNRSAPRASTRMAPRIFGTKRMPSVASANMRVECASHSGQIGKSWRGLHEVLRADHGVENGEACSTAPARAATAAPTRRP